MKSHKNHLAKKIFATMTVGAVAFTLASCGTGGGEASSGAADPEAAAEEGTVVIYGSTSEDKLTPIFDAFMAQNEGIEIEYNDLSSTTIYNRVLTEGNAGGATADVVFSSAPDLFSSLVDQGMAAQYESPEAAAYPEGAIYDSTLYTLRYEPICQAYNKQSITEEQLPVNHDDIARVVEEFPEQYDGKIGGYDVEKSGVGYLIGFKSEETFPNFWDTADAIGTTDPQFESSASMVVEKIASGELNFGYNLPCSVVTPVAEDNENIGMAYDDAQILSLPTVGFVSAAAENPNAGKLLLDFMLGAEGQQQVADISSWYSAREDTTGPGFDKAQYQDALAPMTLTEADFESYRESLQPEVRSEFLDQWKAAVAAG